MVMLFLLGIWVLRTLDPANFFSIRIPEVSNSWFCFFDNHLLPRPPISCSQNYAMCAFGEAIDLPIVQQFLAVRLQEPGSTESRPLCICWLCHWTVYSRHCQDLSTSQSKTNWIDSSVLVKPKKLICVELKTQCVSTDQSAESAPVPRS